SSLEGSLSILPVPDGPTLAQYTRTVYDLTPYTDETRLAPGSSAGSPIPARVGDPSPIAHVFYIIKENRTYDQILGDLDRGNGDRSLTEFGERITPNFHNIARQFVDLDNFYDSGEVSGDGWPWSTSARESDFGEKAVVLQYADRGTNYEYEGLNRDIN